MTRIELFYNQDPSHTNMWSRRDLALAFQILSLICLLARLELTGTARLEKKTGVVEGAWPMVEAWFVLHIQAHYRTVL